MHYCKFWSSAYSLWPVKFWSRQNWNSFLFLGEFPTARRALPRRAVEGAAVLSTRRTAAESASPLRLGGCRLRAPQRCAVPCRVKVALGPIHMTFFLRALNAPSTQCNRNMYTFAHFLELSRVFLSLHVSCREFVVVTLQKMRGVNWVKQDDFKTP